MSRVSLLALLLTFVSCTVSASAQVGRNHITAGIFLEPPVQGREAIPPDLRVVVPYGLAITKVAEGWVATRYNDSAGYCTIGYGHLIKKARCDGTEPAEFLKALTKTRGEEILQVDMVGARLGVFRAVKTELSDAQFAALCDFTFNVGVRNFQTSTLLKVVNDRRFDQVSSQLMRWTSAGGAFTPGLVNRRKQEIALFFRNAPQPRSAPDTTLPQDRIDILKGE